MHVMLISIIAYSCRTLFNVCIILQLFVVVFVKKNFKVHGDETATDGCIIYEDDCPLTLWWNENR